MITVERDFDLTAFNTFGMKVKCACFVEYDRAEDLDTIFGGGMELPGPFLHIGGGSNLLFTGDYAGTVLHSRISSVGERAVGTDVELTVGAGVRFDDVCAWWPGEGCGAWRTCRGFQATPEPRLCRMSGPMAPRSRMRWSGSPATTL